MMIDRNKLNEVLDDYIARMDNRCGHRLQPDRFAHHETMPHEVKALQHCVWMKRQMSESAMPDPDKAMRWLCFIQGVLWMDGLLSIEDAANHNRGILGKDKQ